MTNDIDEWRTLHNVATSDLVAFIVLDYMELRESSGLWLASQAVEKHLKSWLSKHGQEFCRKGGKAHNLEKLWELCRTHFGTQYPELLSRGEFKAIVKGLNSIDDKVRYGKAIPWTTERISPVLVLCNELRKAILGNDYQPTNYGLQGTRFDYQNKIDIEIDGSEWAKVVRKMVMRRHQQAEEYYRVREAAGQEGGSD